MMVMALAASGRTELGEHIREDLSSALSRFRTDRGIHSLRLRRLRNEGTFSLFIAVAVWDSTTSFISGRSGSSEDFMNSAWHPQGRREGAYRSRSLLYEFEVDAACVESDLDSRICTLIAAERPALVPPGAMFIDETRWDAGVTP